MGFFASLFGSGSDNQFRDEWSISADRIRELVSRTTVNSLDQKEEKMVEDALVAARIGGAKLSLHKIDRTLVSLEQKRIISRYDREALLKVFEKEKVSVQSRYKK